MTKDAVTPEGEAPDETGAGAEPVSPRFREAADYAMELHAGQFRKGTQTPYIAHLFAVAAIVMEAGGTEDQAIAALLHDGPEDQGGEETLARIRERFGDAVADIVEACSDTFEVPKPPWRERKQAYIDHLQTAPPEVLLVSLADKLHNAQSVVRDKREIGDEIFTRFRGGRDGTLWYYESLATTFCARYPGPLAEELREVVGEMSGGE